MAKILKSVHSKSHEDRAHHEGRSGDRSALARALDPRWSVLQDNSHDPFDADKPQRLIFDNPYEDDAFDESDNRGKYEEAPLGIPSNGENYSYDEASGPPDMTRRAGKLDVWAPNEWEQEQNRMQKDAVLDAVTKAFKK